jgi:hypothetical protein
MRKKCNTLALWSFVIALATYVFTYLLYHYLGPDGSFVHSYHETAVKPFVTLMFGIIGVMFHFAGLISLLIGKIFFSKE